MNPTLMDTEIAQERRLVTEIPGPRSQGLLAKKTEAVSSGVGVGLPVFIERASQLRIGLPVRGGKPARSGRRCLPQTDLPRILLHFNSLSRLGTQSNGLHNFQDMQPQRAG